MQDTALLEARFKKFIKTVCANERVYVLQSEEGYAICDSKFYKNIEKAPKRLMCCWSHSAMAEVAKVCFDGDFEIEPVDLASFIENWCFDIHEDEMVVGIDFDTQLEGYEIDSIDLIQQLINELRVQNKELYFDRFDSLDEIEYQIND